MYDMISNKLNKISMCARYDLYRMAPILAPKSKNGAKHQKWRQISIFSRNI